MKILTVPQKLEKPCCVALGFFDGTHLGHQKILTAMRRYAEENSLTPCVFTFAQSPCALLGKDESRALQSFSQRLGGIEEFGGARLCFAVDFLRYKDIAAEDFVNSLLLDTLNVRAAFCGFNFRFGKNALGDTSTLEKCLSERGAKLFVTEPVCKNGETVSSSRIRRLIGGGKIMEANAMLAHPFSIEGEIIHGRQNGRTVGIPTINQTIPADFVVPKLGAYASFAVVGGRRYKAVTNIGVRPTVQRGSAVNCETHILEDVEGELYGENVRTELLWFEREERRFEDLSALSEQIHRDIAHIDELNIYNLYINGEYKNGCP